MEECVLEDLSFQLRPTRQPEVAWSHTILS